MAETVDLKNAPKTGNPVATREYIFGERYKMFNDNYKDQVRRRLFQVSPTAETLGLDKQLDLTNNVYKTIVNKISRVYSSGVKRDFSDVSMEELYDKVRIDKYMKQANKYVNAFNDVLLQVSWNEAKNEPRFVFRYPHKTRVVLDGMGEPSEVEYFVSFGEDGDEKWAYWSNSEHYYKVYKKDGKVDKVVLEGNEQGINPYGTLPFVFIQNGFRDASFWDIHTGNDMVEVTLDMAVYKTMLNHTQKWQSFKQLYVTGSNVGAISGQILDPSSALTVEGDDTTLGLLDLQADIKSLGESIDGRSTNVAMNYNISPNQFRMTGQVSSGFALKMENSALDQFTIDQQSDFQDYEVELYRLIVTIGNAFGAGLSESYTFNVNFDEIAYSESQGDTATTNQTNIGLGLTSPIEIIMDEKGVDEDEAKRIYEENIKYRNMANNNLNAPTLNEETTAQAMGLDVTA